MSEKKAAKIQIKWVRSGIGFPYRQKDVVKSLGLRRLNHVVECEDTPQIRGLIAKVPHLVEIVESGAGKRSKPSPEYTIVKRDAVGPENASEPEPQNPSE
ncbi:MAG: 50S ribosomal protein L30 [Terriglobia bacterium]